MKPLYIKKNGQVEKVTGAFAMPATYPAERVAYDNTNSGLSADDAQGAIDEIVEEVNDKVDKVAGKGLSTNDFTNEDKALIGQTLGNNTVLTTDKTPFLTRQTLNPTGFSGYVREKLVGASYAWNQLLNITSFADNNQWTSETITSNGNNKYTITFSGSEAGRCFLLIGVEGQLLKNHKYLFKPNFTIKSGSIANTTCYYRFDYGNTGLITKAGDTMFNSILFESDGNYTFNRLATYNSDSSSITSSTVITFQFELIDLTLAFGSTIADYLYGLSNNGGITKLRDMGCPIDSYTAYGYGLYSVKTSGKKIYGYYLKPTIISGARGSTGTITTNGTRTITDDYILLAPNVYKLYAKTSVNGKTLRVAYHFWANTTVGQNSQTYDSGWLNISESMDLVISSNVIFDMGFSYSDNSNINPSDLEVKLVANETTYPLGNDELRGKFDLVNGEIVASGDVKESNGGITRKWKEIDLGSLDYQRSNNAGNWDNWLFFVQISDMANYSEKICAIYTMSDEGIVHVSNKCITRANNNYLYIRDDSYTDTTTFKTAMNGIKLIYVLATPTTEQSTPFADPISMVGATTEEYIDTRDIPCPVGAERQYMGESDDVIPIPSSPMSDGERYLKSIVSGGKEQYVWDSEKIIRKELYYNFGNVVSGTRYSFAITDNYPEINKNTLASISISFIQGASVFDYEGKVGWNFGSSYPDKIYINYTSAYTQNSAYVKAIVTYYIS